MTEKELAVFAGNIKAKKIKVITTQGNVFTGVIDCFTTGADNEPDKASIMLIGKPFDVELFVNEIQSIKEIWTQRVMPRVFFHALRKWCVGHFLVKSGGNRITYI